MWGFLGFVMVPAGAVSSLFIVSFLRERNRTPKGTEYLRGIFGGPMESLFYDRRPKWVVPVLIADLCASLATTVGGFALTLAFPVGAWLGILSVLVGLGVGVVASALVDSTHNVWVDRHGSR
jgi:ABC-type dipeptide/oligopeptide/nickel transport system permease component